MVYPTTARGPFVPPPHYSAGNFPSLGFTNEHCTRNTYSCEPISGHVLSVWWDSRQYVGSVRTWKEDGTTRDRRFIYVMDRVQDLFTVQLAIVEYVKRHTDGA